MRRSRTPWTTALLAGALALTPALLHADELPASGLDADASVKQADEHFRKANELYKDEKWAEAEVEFQAAWAIRRTYDTAANMGHTEFHLGKFRDAAEHLKFAVDNWPPTGKPEPLQLAQAKLGEAEKEVAALTLTVNPAGAAVSVDGKKTEVLGKVLYLEPGKHTIGASLEGYIEKTESVDAEKGGSKTLALELQPAKAGGPKTAVLIGGAALAVVGVGIGIGLLVASSGKKNDGVDATDALVKTRGSQPCHGTYQGSSECLDIQSTFESSDSLRTGSTIAFIAGGAFAAGTLVYYLVTRKSSAPVAASAGSWLRVAPAVGRGQDGLVLSGTW